MRFLGGNHASVIAKAACAYDAVGNLTSVTRPDGSLVAAGRRTSLAYPNGIVASYAYDAAGQLLSVTHTRSSDVSLIASAAYTYDAAGNRTSMQDWAGTRAYSYDDLHRLTSASHPTGTGLDVQNETFSYDAVGNRLSDAKATGYLYDTANRLSENTLHTYTHDADGNRTSKTVKATSAATTYSYDSQNRLIGATLPDGTQWTYKYDGQGRRIEKRSGPAPSQIFRYIYDRDNILAIVNGDGVPLVVYTNGLDIDEPLMLKDAAGGDYSIHAEPLGSVIAHADASGALAERIAHEAYGLPVFTDMRGGTPSPEPGGSFTGSPLAFTGRVWDAERRQYDYRNRQVYDPETGRFGQEDPTGLLSGDPNLFAFVENRPTFYTDPLGLKPYDPNGTQTFDDWWNDPTTTVSDIGPYEGIQATYLEVDLALLFTGAPKAFSAACRAVIPKQYLRWGWRRFRDVPTYRISGDWIKLFRKNPHINL